MMGVYFGEWGGDLRQVKTIIFNCFRQHAFPSILLVNTQQSWEADSVRGAVPTSDSGPMSLPQGLFLHISPFLVLSRVLSLTVP